MSFLDANAKRVISGRKRKVISILTLHRARDAGFLSCLRGNSDRVYAKNRRSSFLRSTSAFCASRFLRAAIESAGKRWAGRRDVSAREASLLAAPVRVGRARLCSIGLKGAGMDTPPSAVREIFFVREKRGIAIRCLENSLHHVGVRRGSFILFLFD